MKTIVRLIIIAVIVLGAQSSHATSPHPSVTIRVLDATSFALYLKQIEDQRLKITLKDSAGEVLYTKRLRNRNSYDRRMNLENLPAGKYSLEISDNVGTLSYPVKMTVNALQIPVDERVATFHPIIRKQNSTVSLVLFSPAKHSHELSIYNENNVLMHGEKINGTVNYQKQFDFSTALPGSYSMVINSEGQKYTYMIPVK